VSEFLVLHRFLEARGLLPEETLPSGKVGALEESVFEYTLDTAECLNHVGAVVVEVPEFAVVLLMRPPEGILFEDLVLLEVLPHSPALVVCECESVLLEECVDPGDTSVPRVLEVVQG
jgi:hypothetical protein